MTIDEIIILWNYYISPELQIVLGISLLLIILIWHMELHDHEIEEEKEERQEIIPGVTAEPERELY